MLSLERELHHCHTLMPCHHLHFARRHTDPSSGARAFLRQSDMCRSSRFNFSVSILLSLCLAPPASVACVILAPFHAPFPCSLSPVTLSLSPLMSACMRICRERHVVVVISSSAARVRVQLSYSQPRVLSPVARACVSLVDLLFFSSNECSLSPTLALAVPAFHFGTTTDTCLPLSLAAAVSACETRCPTGVHLWCLDVAESRSVTHARTSDGERQSRQTTVGSMCVCA